MNVAEICSHGREWRVCPVRSITWSLMACWSNQSRHHPPRALAKLSWKSLFFFNFGDATEISLTHWGRVTHICVGKLIIIGSDNGLSPDRRQAIIWTNAGISLIGPLGTNFSEISIRIQTFSFKKMHLKMASAKWRPSCLGLNVLKTRMRETWSCST